MMLPPISLASSTRLVSDAQERRNRLLMRPVGGAQESTPVADHAAQEEAAGPTDERDDERVGEESGERDHSFFPNASVHAVFIS